MKYDMEITAEQILAGRAPAISPYPAPDAGRQIVSAREVVAAFRQRFEAGSDSGVRKRLSNIIFEPPNPFGPRSRRRARQETMVLVTLVFAAIVLTTYFNLNAPVR
jgi:hypothetical protein